MGDYRSSGSRHFAILFGLGIPNAFFAFEFSSVCAFEMFEPVEQLRIPFILLGSSQ